MWFQLLKCEYLLVSSSDVIVNGIFLGSELLAGQNINTATWIFGNCDGHFSQFIDILWTK